MRSPDPGTGRRKVGNIPVVIGAVYRATSLVGDVPLASTTVLGRPDTRPLDPLTGFGAGGVGRDRWKTRTRVSVSVEARVDPVDPY